MTVRTARLQLEMLAAQADAHARARGGRGSANDQLAVPSAVIGSAERCWCGEPYGHHHRERE